MRMYGKKAGGRSCLRLGESGGRLSSAAGSFSHSKTLKAPVTSIDHGGDPVTLPVFQEIQYSQWVGTADSAGPVSQSGLT